MFQLRNNESNSSEGHSQDYIRAQWKELTVVDLCVRNRGVLNSNCTSSEQKSRFTVQDWPETRVTWSLNG